MRCKRSGCVWPAVPDPPPHPEAAGLCGPHLRELARELNWLHREVKARPIERTRTVVAVQPTRPLKPGPAPISERILSALNKMPNGGTSGDIAMAVRLKKPVVLHVLAELKKAGKVRVIGVAVSENGKDGLGQNIYVVGGET